MLDTGLDREQVVAGSIEVDMIVLELDTMAVLELDMMVAELDMTTAE